MTANKPIPFPSEKPWLSIPEAGPHIGCKSRSAAYRAAKSGGLPTIRISERHWVVPTAALRALLGLPIESDQTAPAVSDLAKSA